MIYGTMICTVLIVMTFASAVFGGSECPPRNSIYPCICLNEPTGKRIMFTAVICQRLPDSDSLSAIFTSLRSIDIDQFHLYDSFWEAHNLGDSGEKQKILPKDWLSLLKIKHMEIVDSTLSSSFACDWTFHCKNSITTRFTATNSSNSEKINGLCPNPQGGGSVFPWTSCLKNLTVFQFTYGRLTSFLSDVFPIAMKELVVVNLTYNQINKIDKKAFMNLPSLVKLDLSHNALENLDLFDDKQKMNIEFLDVSWNSIKSIGKNLFSVLPQLKVFNAEQNRLIHLEKSDWKGLPTSLKTVNLNHNPIHCGCSVRWISDSFPKRITITGRCSSPREYENSYLRIASAALNKRCDGNDNIRTKKVPFRTTPVTKSHGNF